MKPKHVQSYRTNARAILGMLNIAVGQQYSTLSSQQLHGLLDPRLVRPPKPMTTYEIFNLLQRQAR